MDRRVESHKQTTDMMWQKLHISPETAGYRRFLPLSRVPENMQITLNIHFITNSNME